MSRIVLVMALLAFAAGSRTQTRDESKSKTKGASCDDLQTMFHDRVVAFQASLDAMPDMDAMTRSSQARVLMRTYGIIRTMRRAKSCAWVIGNDSDDIQQVRGIVQNLLAGNPCADAARSELESGMSSETAEVEIQSIARAMWVLSSDDCEVAESDVPMDSDVMGTLDDQLIDAENSLQDAIVDMEDGESSFIELKSGSLRSFMRGVGIAFLMLFLLLACAGAVATIGVMLGMVVLFLVEQISYGGACQGPGCLGLLIFPIMGLYGGGALGIAGCAYQMYTQLLPRLRN